MRFSFGPRVTRFSTKRAGFVTACNKPRENRSIRAHRAVARTSGGEARAVAVLQEEFASRGGSWTDMPVAGGGGDAAMTALRARVLSGNAPTAVQLKGPAIQEWYEEGVLADISAVAEAEGWADILPASIAGHMQCDGTWCAAPVNVHRVDWVWANKAILDEHGIEMPSNWDEFNAAAEKLQAAGITPLAHGGQAWQDATVFETVVLGLGGADFFRSALIDLDMDALRSDTMKAVFDQMRTMRGYVDANFSGRDWNLATAMGANSWPRARCRARISSARLPPVMAICITSTALPCSMSKVMTQLQARTCWQS